MKKEKNGINIEKRDMADSRSCVIFDNPKWLSTKDAAIYLRKFRKDGDPSEGAIRTAIWRRELRARKWRGRLYILREELDRLINNAPFVNGGY